MTTPTFDPNQGPTDAWNSPLWGRPDTVGGYWNDQPVADPHAPDGRSTTVTA